MLRSDGRRAIAVLVLALFSVTWARGASGDGAIGIGPNFQTGQQIPDVVGLRYKFRVNAHQSTGLKLIFGSKRFYAPGNPDTYLLESNLYSNWLRYPDSSCLGWPPRSPTNEYFSAESGLWVSVPDYPRKGKVGVKQMDAATLAMFPRQNSGIDAISGLTKIETISQMNVTGKDISIEYTRGGTFTQPRTGYGHRFRETAPDAGTFLCEANLPADTYRQWLVRATIDGIVYRWEFVLPDASAQYFAPWEIISFVTEFFNHPGFFQAYFWEMEILREASTSWQPLLEWKMFYRSDLSNVGYGPKLAQYSCKTVIELSNDGTNTYYQLNDIFRLSSPDGGTAGGCAQDGGACAPAQTTQPCSSACGSGTETCNPATGWGGCTAPSPGATQACTAGQCGAGTQVCTASGWGACMPAQTNACGACGPVPDEVCDGRDNNCNGQIDEGVTCQNGVCVNGTCVDPCRGVTCPADRACNGGVCVDDGGVSGAGCGCATGAGALGSVVLAVLLAPARRRRTQVSRAR